MASINNLPVGATLLEEFTGKVNKPDAWTHGKTIKFSHYRDMCSKGYKSDYQQVETHFLVLRVEGERTQCKMFSGKRIEKAVKTFAAWKSDLTPYLI